MKVIGLTGYARSGKDTFYSYIKQYLNERKITCRRFAFADSLKFDIDEFIFSRLGFSSFTNDSEQKKILRPLLVSYGCAMRDLTKGRYWIDILEKDIKSVEKFVDVAVITDVRFCDYENDEVSWLKNTMGGKLINISLIGSDGFPNPPANEEEKSRGESLFEQSDYHFLWSTINQDKEIESYQRSRVFEFLSQNEILWKP